ncbi:MAG TPA: hypothetical protein VK638_28040 [Edaphobacter sp.]|nr:hypothetical protein [Edaphobacter sp.]
MGTPGSKAHLRQSAILLASIWSFFFLEAAITRSINGVSLDGVRKQMIVDPAAEDRSFHGDGPQLG